MKKYTLISILFTLVFLFSSCGNLSDRSSYRTFRKDIKGSLAYKSRYDVPVIINEEVIQQINYFQGNGRRHFERYLERSGRYVPMMRKILKEHGLPEDLVYLALIESGFNLKAHSRARAVGPWQFIYWTGHRYGLKVDTWVDERCDPVKATHAAAGYLKALYNEFGDWYLAMAGYNAGEGKIRNAIKRYHSRDFWTLSGDGNRYLKPETRNYVPKFIAAVLMAKNPEEFGFGHVKLQPPLEYETVEIDSQTEIKVIATLAGTSVETVESLNPELRRWATPPDNSYSLKLPKGSAESFKPKFAQLPKNQRVTIAYHWVGKGEVLSKIARKYGVSTDMLMEANNITNPRRIHPNQKLVIPIHGSLKVAHGESTKPTKPTKPTERKRQFAVKGDERAVVYKVSYGDSLWEISQKFDVSVDDLKRWNNIKNHRHIKPGQKLTVYGEERETTSIVASAGNKAQVGATKHKILWGESLWTISRKYGTSTNQIKKWNGIKDPKYIKPGDELIVSGIPETTSLPVVAAKEQKTQDIESLPTDRQVNSGNKTVHVVKNGESLWTIAKKYNVSIEKIKEWNEMSDTKIYAGKKLAIKDEGTHSEETLLASAQPEEIASSVNAENSSDVHVVESGDTIWDIAKKYNVSTTDIKSWNSLQGKRHIKPGDKLTIRK